MAAKKAIEKKKIDKATGISCSVSAIITRADGTIEDLGIIAESINENEVRKNTKAIQEAITASKTANISIETVLPTTSKKKLKSPKFKPNKSYGSIPTSLTNSELMKEHPPERINRGTKIISSQEKNTNTGVIGINEKRIEIDAYSEKTDTDMLTQFKNIGLTREEFQIYLALNSLYIQNVPKKKYGEAYEISTKDFHNKVLENKNRIRKSDLKRYANIFTKLSCVRIKVDTSSSIIPAFNKRKDLKNITLEDNIINIGVFGDSEYKEQIIRILPTSYTLFEIKSVKMISNFFAPEFISLDMDKHNNILFFGYYLTRLHNTNRKNASNGGFMWSINFETFIKDALPNGEKVIQEYKKNREKTKYFEREILKPLKNAILIMSNRGYVLGHRFEELNTKKMFSDHNQKLVITFNYDKAKLISISLV